MFNIGGSKNSSNSQSSSLDFGVNTSSSFSDSLARAVSESLARSESTAGGQSTSRGASVSGGQSTGYGSSVSRGASTGLASSTSTQDVWNADILQKLYKDAMGSVGGADLFSGRSAELYGAGIGILDSLGAGAGEDYLQARLTDTSARDAQLGALQTGLGDLFREELNPAITGSAISAGQLGGGRQGVAQGQASKAIASQYVQGAADIIGRDQSARDQAASQYEQLRLGRASTQLGALDPLLGTAQASLNGPLSQYAQLAGIVGGPAVLTQSGSTSVSQSQNAADALNTSQSTNFANAFDEAQSTNFADSFSESSSMSESEQIARAISEAFGFNFGESSSTSTSKGKSFSLGF